MLTGLHILLTYRCTHACDHCFLFGSPQARGTFTLSRLRDALDQAQAAGTIEWIYFEGGEPFLYYPLLLAGLDAARRRGFRVGVVSNAYWAEAEEDAELWLEGLLERDVDDVSLSDDAFHHDPNVESPAARALAAARRLGLPASRISISPPCDGDDVRFRGRAADCLTEGRPREDAATFGECPDEDLADPSRIHLDSDGNIHLCQGILLGNLWREPLVDLLKNYDPQSHPIVGPLLRGGPHALATEHGVELDEGYVSACHLCFLARRQLRERFLEVLGPKQVYAEP